MSEDALQVIRRCPFDRNSLELIARRTGSGRSAIEKDFVISALFIILTSSPNFSKYTRRMSFRGGTCLKKVFYPDEMRFSEDLDFSGLTPAECGGFHAAMNELIGKDLGATSFTETRVQYDNERGLDFLVFYTSVLRQKNHIAFNLSTTKAMKKAKNMDVHVEPYFTSLHPAIPTMNIDEIIAEKVRALLQRTKPRDVFDVWFLMESKGKKLDIELLRAKLRRSYDAAPDKSKKNIENYVMSEIVSRMIRTVTGRAWQNELGGLLMRPKPDPQTVIESVSRILARIGDVSLG